MLARVTGFFVLLATIPAWPQVEPGATGGAATTDSDTQMMTPPPVSGSVYPTTGGSETQSNYLSTGVTVVGGYLNNVFLGGTAAPSDDATFSILPNFTLSRSTSRQQETLTYSPSFLIFEPSSELNAIDQGAAVAFEDRLSPVLSVNVQDSFFRSSDVFDQSSAFSGGGVSGSTQTPISTVIAPFAEQLSNTAHAVVSYQFGRDGMVGGGGYYSILNYLNPLNSSGLSDFSGGGASAFYNRRLSSKQYTGFSYQYARGIAQETDQQSETQTHSILPFYSFYFSKTLSFSISAGAQRVYVSLPQLPTAASWSPSIDASMGWQASRGSIAANYFHTVTAGEGLFGAFNANGAGASGNLRLARTWNGGVSVFYIKSSNVTSQFIASTNGSTVSGQATLTHTLGEHFAVAFGYARLRETYIGIAAISPNPNTDSATVSISYQFKKPLER